MRAGSGRRADMRGSRRRNQKEVMPRGWLSFSYQFLRFKISARGQTGCQGELDGSLSGSARFILLLCIVDSISPAPLRPEFRSDQMSRLLNAVFKNDLPKVASLLDRDPKRVQDVEALCQGIGWGRKEAVMMLIQRGAELNTKDRNDNHPLKMACRSPALELFEELVRHGSDPACAKGLAVDAAMCGRTEVLRYLYQAGFDLNHSNQKGIRPIEAAIGNGHLVAVEYLLSVNVDIVAIDASKPFVPWKGVWPDGHVFEDIRKRIIAKKAKQASQA
jgi:hypothetical protein